MGLLEAVVRDTHLPNLSVLPAGPGVEDPAEWLHSSRMDSIVDTLSERYDAVLVDSPALLSVSDAAGMVSLADSILLVVREAGTNRDAVGEALERLDTVGALSVRVVVNCSRRIATTYQESSRNGAG